ncbi:MAG: hypothetical protein LAT83_16335, partial [Kiritimatiellae bacterium]|nr:hypothetical protein [Kiritimatiellia bacterium]
MKPKSTFSPESSAIEARLAIFAQRWRQLAFRRGAAITLTVAILAILLAAGVDAIAPLGLGQRQFLSLLTWGIIAATALLAWGLPVWLPVSPERMAWILEKQLPDLDERLISSVELARNQDEDISKEMILALLAQAGEDLSHLDPQRTLRIKPWHFAPAVLAVFFFLFSLAHPELNGTQRAKRVLLPSARDAEVGSFRLIAMEPGSDTFVEEEPLTFTVRPTNTEVAEVLLELDGARRRVIPMTRREDGTFLHTLDRPSSSFSYRFKSGDVATTVRDMRMLRRPRVEELQVRYTLPEYTGRDPVETRIRDGKLKGLPGTGVRMSARFSQPLSEATLSLDGLELSPEIDAETEAMVFSFPLETAGEYTLTMRNREAPHLENTFKGTIELEVDRPPEITLEYPGDEFMIEPGDPLYVAWQARDDFGVTGKTLHLQRNGRTFKEVELETGDREKVLDTGPWGLQTGEALSLRLEARDGAGNRSRTSWRRVTVVSGREHMRGVAFEREGREMVKLLDEAVANVEEMRLLRDEILAVTRGRPGRAEDLRHNQNQLQHRQARLQRSADEIASRTQSWMAQGFFEGSDRYIGLLRRYWHVERMLTLPILVEDLQNEDPWGDAERLVRLSSELGRALMDKAGEVRPWLRVNALNQILQQTGHRDDETSLAWNQRLLERSRDFFRESYRERLEVLADLRFDRNTPTPRQGGMKALIYPGRDSFPPFPPDPETPHEKTRLDERIHFESTEAMGLGEAKPGAIHWSGLFFVETPGRYRFRITSKDGSRLLINEEIAIRNDGTHDMRERNTRTHLQRGWIRLDLLYFNGPDDGGMIFEWDVPGSDRETFPAARAWTDFEGTPLMLARELQEVENNLREAAEERDRLNRIAREISEHLRDPAEMLAAVDRDFAEGKREDVGTLPDHMARALDDLAARAPLTEQARENRQQAEALRDVARAEAPGELAKAADSLSRLDHAAQSRELEADLVPGFAELRERLSDLRAAQPRGEEALAAIDRAQIGREAETLQRDLERLWDRQFGETTLRNNPDTRNIRSALREAHSELDTFREALERGETDTLASRADAALARLDQAESRLAEMRAESESRAREATEVLAGLRADPADVARQTADERAELGALERRGDPEDALPSALARSDAEADQLADRFRREALNALSGQDPDPRLAAVNLALAEETERARQDPDLQSSAERLDEVASMAEALRDRDRHALSLGEEQALEARLDPWLAESLSPELAETLARMEQLREPARELDALARALSAGEMDDVDAEDLAARLAALSQRLEPTPSPEITRGPGEDAPLDPSEILAATDRMRRELDEVRAERQLPLDLKRREDPESSHRRDEERLARDLTRAADRAEAIREAAEQLPEALRDPVARRAEAAAEHARRQEPEQALASLDAIDRTLREASETAALPKETPADDMQRLAAELDQALRHQETRIAPLEQALQALEDRQLEAAAVQAARAPEIPEALAALDEALETYRQAMRETEAGVMEAESGEIRSPLLQAAEALAKREPESAAEALAGREDPLMVRSAEAVQAAEQARERAREALETSLAAAMEATPSPERLEALAAQFQEMAGEASRDLEERMAQQAADQGASPEAAQQAATEAAQAAAQEAVAQAAPQAQAQMAGEFAAMEAAQAAAEQM